MIAGMGLLKLSNGWHIVALDEDGTLKHRPTEGEEWRVADKLDVKDPAVLRTFSQNLLAVGDKHGSRKVYIYDPGLGAQLNEIRRWIEELRRSGRCRRAEPLFADSRIGGVAVLCDDELLVLDPVRRGELVRTAELSNDIEFYLYGADVLRTSSGYVVAGAKGVAELSIDGTSRTALYSVPPKYAGADVERVSASDSLVAVTYSHEDWDYFATVFYDLEGEPAFEYRSREYDAVIGNYRGRYWLMRSAVLVVEDGRIVKARMIRGLNLRLLDGKVSPVYPYAVAFDDYTLYAVDLERAVAVELTDCFEKYGRWTKLGVADIGISGDEAYVLYWDFSVERYNVRRALSTA